jgi:cytoplasmic iron level regulating protein YaaA (DUF328/UPF0246 family)
MKPVILIGCGKTKLPSRALGRMLYTGNLFRAAKAYAQTHGSAWYILSAKYGLVHPDDVLDPYDLVLTDLDRADRELWGKFVQKQLKKAGVWGLPIVFLAGSEYARAVSGAPDVTMPLEGLGIGERLRWFKQHT